MEYIHQTDTHTLTLILRSQLNRKILENQGRAVGDVSEFPERKHKLEMENIVFI